MELEMLEMVELPNQSIRDNGVAGSETMEMLESKVILIHLFAKMLISHILKSKKVLY